MRARDLLPGRARAREGRARRRSTAPRSTPSAAATTTARASSASSPARSTGASSTSTSAPTTPRARRRSRSRSSSSSAGRRPTRSSCRSAPARCSRRSGSGFDQFRRLELSTGPVPKLFGGQAEGCAPVASAFAEDRRVTPVRPQSIVSSIAIGNPADGDLAIAAGARSRAAAIYSVPEDEVGANIALLAETGGHLRRGRDRRARSARSARRSPRRARRERPRRACSSPAPA